MMHPIQSILSLDRTLFFVAVQSKKKVLEIIADTFANTLPMVQSTEIFDALIIRERLGSTGIGSGIAIPHARVKNIDAPYGCFITLKTAIDFNSEDHQGVDLIFTLIVPEEGGEQHNVLLSYLEKIFCEKECQKRLRQATSRTELYERIIRA